MEKKREETKIIISEVYFILDGDPLLCTNYIYKCMNLKSCTENIKAKLGPPHQVLILLL